MDSKSIFTARVVKRDDEEFEFFLKMNSDRRQYIAKVTEGGPAARADVRHGDQLIEVNGVNVENLTHEETVEMIRDSVSENKVVFKLLRDTRNMLNGDRPSRPRICKLVKKDGSFGFNLKGFAAREKQAHIAEKVREGGPAYVSGVREDDRIIKVNKTNVEKLTHQQLVTLIKKSGNKLTLLVCDASTYHHYKSKKKKISEKDSLLNEVEKLKQISHSTSLNGATSDQSNVAAAKQLHIFPAKSGMGFYLRSKNEMAEEFAGGIEEDGAGYLCGLRNDDQIIAVNGISIHNKSHEEVIALMKSNQHHAILVVLSPKTLSVIEEKGIKQLKETQTTTIDKPRVIEMNKGKDGYGFYLKMEQGCALHILGDIEDGSIAERAGIKNMEILAAVNGVSVLRSPHKECVDRIKESGEHVSLTVGSRQAIDIFQKLKIDVTREFLDSWPQEEAFIIPSFEEFFKKRKISENVKENAADVKKAKTKRTYVPRLCHLKRGEFGYSFYLREEEGHRLEQVEVKGAAYKAGVREWDTIIEVNGKNVVNETHEEVVMRIRERKDSVTFLVVDEETRKHFLEEGIAITAELIKASKNEESNTTGSPKPRFVHLVKDRTFGFHLNSEQLSSRPGQYVRQVAEGGVADVAGVKEGDRIIEINGINIENKYHKDVVAMIIASNNEVNFLVVDEEADIHYKKLGIAITMKLLNDVDTDDKDSVSSSKNSIQAEATVHHEANVEPVIHFPSPPPPEDEEEKANAIKSIVDLLEDEEKRLEEAKVEIAEEVKEEIAENVAEVVVGAIAEEIAENKFEEDQKVNVYVESIDSDDDDTREEIVEEIKEEIRENIEEEVKEEMKEEIEEDIVEAIANEFKEESVNGDKESIKDEILEEVKEDIKEEIKEKIEDEIAEDIKDEIAEDIKDEIAEDIKENIAEEIVEEIKEKSNRLTEEELKKEIREQLRKEAEKEMKEQLRKEAQEELKARMKEEIKREMLEEAARAAAAASIISIPDPPSPTSSTISTKRDKSDSILSMSTTASDSSSTKNEMKTSIDFSELTNVRLKPVKERLSKKEVAKKEPQTVEQVKRKPSTTDLPNNLRSRIAVFEKDKKSASTSNGRASLKANDQSNQIVNKKATLSNKPFTFNAAASMKFKIVETTPIIN